MVNYSAIKVHRKMHYWARVADSRKIGKGKGNIGGVIRGKGRAYPRTNREPLVGSMVTDLLWVRIVRITVYIIIKIALLVFCWKRWRSEPLRAMLLLSNASKTMWPWKVASKIVASQTASLISPWVPTPTPAMTTSLIIPIMMPTNHHQIFWVSI